MRVVRLGKVAAQAEGLRVRRLVRRTAMRGAFGATAAVFALMLLICLHVAGVIALVPQIGPLWSVLAVAAVDLVLAGGLGALAAFSSPDRIEREAYAVREEARAQLAEAAVMTALVGPVLRRVGTSLLSRMVRRRAR